MRKIKTADRAGASGHWASQVLIGSILVAIGLRVRPIDSANPLALFIPLMLMVVVVASWLRMRAHDRQLCERCMHAIPLNAAESAARYRRRLATVHLASRRSLVIEYLTVLIAALLIPGTAGIWIWAVLQATMIYLVLSTNSHRLLQPWCPVCSGEGGGGGRGDRNSPDPTPRLQSA